MKKLILILILVLLPCLVFAQTSKKTAKKHPKLSVKERLRLAQEKEKQAAVVPARPVVSTDQNKLPSDPEQAVALQKLVQDPQMKQLLSDPRFLSAIMSKDIKAIRFNQNTPELIKNPPSQDIVNKEQKNKQNNY